MLLYQCSAMERYQWFLDHYPGLEQVVSGKHVASFIGEMNFIKKDGKTIAVRPEDLTVTPGAGGEITGTVRTVMLLGHYVVMTVQCGDNVIKCNVDRELSEKLNIGDEVSLSLGKHTIFQ